MFQLVYLKKFGLDAQKLSQVETGCWNALENTVLAEHLSSWKLILRYTPQLKLGGRIHDSELYFDSERINSSVKAELFRLFEWQGYQAEGGEEAYIFTPPYFDHSWYRMWLNDLPFNFTGGTDKKE